MPHINSYLALLDLIFVVTRGTGHEKDRLDSVRDVSHAAGRVRPLAIDVDHDVDGIGALEAVGQGEAIDTIIHEILCLRCAPRIVDVVGVAAKHRDHHEILIGPGREEHDLGLGRTDLVDVLYWCVLAVDESSDPKDYVTIDRHRHAITDLSPVVAAAEQLVATAQFVDYHTQDITISDGRYHGNLTLCPVHSIMHIRDQLQAGVDIPDSYLGRIVTAGAEVKRGVGTVRIPAEAGQRESMTRTLPVRSGCGKHTHV